MPNPNVGLYSIAVIPSFAGTVCGFVIEPDDPAIGAVIDDAVPDDRYLEKFYECDTRDILAYTSNGHKICVNYDSISVKSDEGTMITYTLSGCEYSHAMCNEFSYMTPYSCAQCPFGRIAMDYFDIIKSAPDGLTNLRYHSNASCDYCESGYLSGNTCINCPDDSDGRIVHATGGSGITSCFLSLGYSTETNGADSTGKYVITVAPDFSEFVNVDGRMEYEHFCSYHP